MSFKCVDFFLDGLKLERVELMFYLRSVKDGKLFCPFCF